MGQFEFAVWALWRLGGRGGGASDFADVLGERGSALGFVPERRWKLFLQPWKTNDFVDDGGGVEHGHVGFDARTQQAAVEDAKS